MARVLRLDARIYVPVGTAQPRIDAIAGEGASVTIVDGGYDNAVRRSAQDAGEPCAVISDTSWEGYEEVPSWVIDGYSTVFAEIEEALIREDRRRPDVVVVPIGVGALGGRDRPALLGCGGSPPADSRRPADIGRLRPRIHSRGRYHHARPPAGPDYGGPQLRNAFTYRLAPGLPGHRHLPRCRRRARARSDADACAGRDRRRGDWRKRPRGHARSRQRREARGGRTRAKFQTGGPNSSQVLMLCTEGATDPDAYRQLTAAEGRTSRVYRDH